VREEGIAPSSPACRTGALLLSYSRVNRAQWVGQELNLRASGFNRELYQLSYQPEVSTAYGNRTRLVRWTGGDLHQRDNAV
jgi:hypothetical protein